MIWPDESKIIELGQMECSGCGSRLERGLIERGVQRTVKLGGGIIMVWGCMGWAGVGKLAEVEGRTYTDWFVDILEIHLLPNMKETGISLEDLIIQEYYDSKHTSKKAKNWMGEASNISLLDWYPQCPDLNPIEHLWYYIKKEYCPQHRTWGFG